jgi:hypothetical protein
MLNSTSLPELIREDGVKLLIAEKLNEADTSQDHFQSKRINWALDNGFEYIEIVLDDITKSK